MNSPHLARTFISRFLPSPGNRANISSRGSKRRCVCVCVRRGNERCANNVAAITGWLDKSKRCGRRGKESGTKSGKTGGRGGYRNVSFGETTRNRGKASRFLESGGTDAGFDKRLDETPLPLFHPALPFYKR